MSLERLQLPNGFELIPYNQEKDPHYAMQSPQGHIIEGVRFSNVDGPTFAAAMQSAQGQQVGDGDDQWDRICRATQPHFDAIGKQNPSAKQRLDFLDELSEKSAEPQGRAPVSSSHLAMQLAAVALSLDAETDIGEEEHHRYARAFQEVLNAAQPAPSVLREALEAAAESLGFFIDNQDGPLVELQINLAQARYDAAIAALATTAPADAGWQDIGTAPMDGTEVFIFRQGWYCALLAHWGEYPGNPVDDGVGAGTYMHGWILKDGVIGHGVEDGFLGWNEDIENGHMPTLWSIHGTRRPRA